MRSILQRLLLLALTAVAWPHDAGAARQTVCTVTVNSADEKEAFRRSLPPDKFQFVELIEPGRSDWLASACRRGIRCDVLVISGHHDGESGFFSDRVEADEYLSPDQMEHESCSDSCPGVFANLKEVYLFGCNTLNPEPVNSASAEVVRSLMRSGHSRSDAERIARGLGERYGGSTRERMRLIFHDVPAIYGFSSVAPLGPTAASFLNRYFHSGGSSEVASGHPSARLVGSFSGHSLTVVRGLKDTDPQAAYRRDVCQFFDDRLSPAQKLRFVHDLLHRDPGEVRMWLDRIERYAASLSEKERGSPDVAQALNDIAQDSPARTRYLEFARDADLPATRARMIELAAQLGWLNADQRRAELMQMISDQLARNAVGPAEVDLVCGINRNHELDAARDDLSSVVVPDRVSHAAMLACLGDAQAHARVLQALTGASDQEARIAEAYLHRRPLSSPAELRSIASAVAQMPNARVQVRALEALAHQQVSDPATLDSLTDLFASTDSVAVQTAIAGILVRADYAVLARPDIVQTLQRHRLRTNGESMIDVLMRHLQPRSAVAQLQPVSTTSAR
ncbi:MAG TPA: hypothetical protein VFC24_00735 [Casimicrobiaceae bacterium]|nr:hypothetical protein [Casimicrobiaceae bacterium]